jgi:hypothetical protein
MLNNQPDSISHLLITGSTGSSKTTFTKALLTHRNGKVLILTPKADDNWSIPFVTLDERMSYTEIDNALSAIDIELKQRHLLVKSGETISEHLTVVIDDYPIIASECKNASRVFKNIARLGRSLRVRLIVLSQSTRVKSINLEGEKDTLDNFLHIELTKQRRAYIEYESIKYELSTKDVLKLSQRVSSLLVWEYDTGINPHSLSSDTDTNIDITDTKAKNTSITDDTLILALLERGISANKIYDVLKGNRNEVMERIRQLKDKMKHRMV